MKKTVYLTIALMILAVSVVSAQQPRMQQRFQQKERPIEQLNLTDEQKEQIGELRTEWQKEQIQLNADLRVARLDLKNLFADPEASDSQIRSMMESVSDQQINLRLKQRSHRMAVRNILTPDQQKIWDDLRENRRLRGGAMLKGRGMRGMRGQGMHRGMLRQGMRRFDGAGPGMMQGRGRNFRGWWDEEIEEIK